MSRLASPLRYPGGKACLYKLATALLSMNGLQQRVYAEPYSGGCGLALSLLYSGHVSQIHLNDIDRSVWAFWQSIIYHTNDFINLVTSTDITVEEWQRQRLIQAQKESAEVLELGFSTFFLNRTNRSGIIHSGGVIGGKNQEGPWPIDCRYNKQDLVKRIHRVSQYKDRIFLYNEDAESFMGFSGKEYPQTAILYIDPPYFDKGSKLYKNFYKKKDHVRISDKISALRNPWFLTYDNVPSIRNLYGDYPTVELDIGYSVQVKRRGSELLVVSKGLRLPAETVASAH